MRTVNNRPINNSWKKPEMGYKKCNYDCNFNQNDVNSKAGWILRDSDGFYIEAIQSRGRVCNSPLEAELQALLMAMQHTWIRGYRRVVFEGDNQEVPKLIRGDTRNFYLHNLIREIQLWRERFTSSIIKWSSWECNKAADRLAKEDIPNGSLFVSHFYVPRFLVQILSEDHSVSS